jgi:hypothetical protein
LKELIQSVDLPRDRVGGEVFELLERDVEAEVPLAGQRVGHGERHARLHRLQAIVERARIDLEELPVLHAR